MRFSLDGDVITFDDGGVNLLSSDALRALMASFRGETLIFKMTRAAGADMAEMAKFTPLEAYEFARLGQETFAAIERMPSLTIAAIDGDCFGGALDLAMAFDLRFATARSRVSHPGAKLGIVTGFGGTSRWRRVIGHAAARRMFLANEVLSAGEALEVGLIDGIGEAQVPATVPFLKELVRHGQHLSQRDLLLLADRLGALYNVPNRQ